MKICLLSVEIFAWGKYGGFGRATRIIGRELAKRGHQVYAVVPRRKGQQEREELDGITVFGFNPYWPWSAIKWIKKADADIYHSCEPSFSTYLAKKCMPSRKHMVTFRDPRDITDWKMEFELPSRSKLQVVLNYIYENNYLVKRCIKEMDGFYSPAKCLSKKIKTIYKLDKQPEFLPTPVTVPDYIKKSDSPVVCSLSRLDRRKRPELFMNLAEQFPDVQFISMGKSRDQKWEQYLGDKYKNVPNLKITGFIDQFSSNELSEILEQSWIMINTATREGLPNAFIESASHKCAILSFVDPDNFASEFGYHADKDDFKEGLKYLLDNNRWKAQGEKGYAYIKDTFELDKSISRHIQIYKDLINQDCNK
jgi:glycosyltransferase involved in cell wall biosynthesis